MNGFLIAMLYVTYTNMPMWAAFLSLIAITLNLSNCIIAIYDNNKARIGIRKMILGTQMTAIATAISIEQAKKKEQVDGQSKQQDNNNQPK